MLAMPGNDIVFRTAQEGKITEAIYNNQTHTIDALLIQSRGSYGVQRCGICQGREQKGERLVFVRCKTLENVRGGRCSNSVWDTPPAGTGLACVRLEKLVKAKVVVEGAVRLAGESAADPMVID